MAWSLLASTNVAAAAATATPAINTTGANLLVVVCGATGSSTISDSAGNTWVDANIQIGTNGENHLWYVAGPVTSASHTVTVSNPVPSQVFGAVDFLAYSGAAVSPFDASNFAAATQPGSITPSQNGDLLIAGASWNATASSGSFSSGFTNQLFTDFASGTNYGLLVATQVQGVAAAINPTVTLGAGSPIQTFIIAFKAAPVTAGPFAARPSTLLLPPNRGMIGWRGLRSLQAIKPPPPTVSLAGIVTTQAKLLAQPRGVVPLAGSATTQTKVQAPLTGSAALAGRATTQAKAQAAMTGAAALRGQVTTQAKVQSRITGTVPLAGTATTQAKVSGLVLFISQLTGRVTTMAKLGGPLTGVASLAGRVTTQAKASSRLSGVVSLAGLITTQAKASGAIVFAAFLSGRVTTMAKIAAPLVGTANLAGRVTTQAKISARVSGLAALAGQVTTQAKTFGLATAGVFAFLQGRVTTQAKLAGAQIGAVTLAGYITAQTKVRALPPAPLGPAAGVHYIRAHNTKFITPGSGVS